MTVITISRQYGSGGDEISRRVSVMLGYRYFDKVLISKISAELGLSDDEVLDFSEDRHQVESFLDRLLGRAHTVGTVTVWKEDGSGVRTYEERPLGAVEATTLVQAAILEAYKEGDVVIVGRGGQALLQCKPGVFHVRIERPWDQRITYVEQHEKVNRVVAQEILIKKDALASDYLKHFYGIDWADSKLYHLLLNSGKLSIETAAQLIACAVKCVPLNEFLT